MIKVVVCFKQIVINVANVNYIFFHQNGHIVGTEILQPRVYVWWVISVRQKLLQYPQTSVYCDMTRMFHFLIWTSA